MGKTYKIGLGIFLLLIAFLTYLEANEPEPVNWASSYSSKDKIPLGAYVFHNNWKSKHQGKFEEIDIPPYEFLTRNSPQGTYFFLNDFVNFDKNELNHLLNWVSKGNTLFVSAFGFGDELEDTLNITTKFHISSKDFTSRPALNLVNPNLKFEKDLLFDHDLRSVYFDKIDTLNQTVLGTTSFVKDAKEREVNFIKAKFGEGNIYLHSTPQAFSNYFLLKESNYKYAQAVLAYLEPGKIVFWDAYYKAGKKFFTSPLYILLNNQELKWAYYFIIIGAVLFIIFEGKRKQRPIPVVEPLANKSYQYTETIAQLYLEQQKFKELAQKKIGLFLEYIRKKFKLNTETQDDTFYQELVAKSNLEKDEVKPLFELIHRLEKQEKVSKEEFHELSLKINSFKEKTDGK